MIVKDLMTRPVHCCDQQDALNRAAQLMWDKDVGAIPVVDRGKRVVGMITDRDIAMAAYTQGRPLDQIEVGSAMARKVYSVHTHDTLDAASEIMRKSQVHRIPVVDQNEQVVGMLSLTDLAKVASKKAGTGHVSLEDVAQTFRRVCEPRMAPVAVA